MLDRSPRRRTAVCEGQGCESDGAENVAIVLMMMLKVKTEGLFLDDGDECGGRVEVLVVVVVVMGGRDSDGDVQGMMMTLLMQL